MNDKRTIQETIDLFKDYSYRFEVEAHRCSDEKIKANWEGKAEAYRIAAFEIERNMQHE